MLIKIEEQRICAVSFWSNGVCVEHLNFHFYLLKTDTKLLAISWEVLQNIYLSGVEGSVVVVGVDAGQFDLVTGFAHIAEIAQKDGVLRTRKTARRNFSGTFLHGDSLVVVVQRLLHVHLKFKTNFIRFLLLNCILK